MPGMTPRYGVIPYFEVPSDSGGYIRFAAREEAAAALGEIHEIALSPQAKALADQSLNSSLTL